MDDRKTSNQQLLICRKEYIRLARDVQQKGISQSEVEICKNTLVKFQDDHWILKSIAYSPTGIALGCSLPQAQTQKLFHHAAQLIERWMRGKEESDIPVFAYVPPEAYHITIVNRSHYEFNEVVPLTMDELKVIQHFISKLRLGTISVLTSGLFLTHTGRLFVKCLVFDDKILQLRSALAESFPQLRTNIPKLVHIKIGHLMKPITKMQLQEFGVFLERLGHYTISRIDFTDLYTPVGRIEL
ncbi:MAG: hypothetical protein HY865_24895 [Chloroflexi bacterium]|nr:hypothetical protein [Chloroflexota bacterium]